MRSPRQLGGWLLLTLLVAAVYFFFDPTQYAFPRCPLHALTGLYCPGCGSQRATHALLHGQLRQAADFNLLAVLALPILAVGAADQVRGSFRAGARPTALLYQPWLSWLTLAATLTFALLRNLPGTLGAWLAP